MASAVRVRVIGPLEVTGARGRLVAGGFPSRKAAQVLAALALAGGRPVAKERLVDQIWGERLPEDPLGALEQAVSVLRRALRTVTDVPVVVTRGGHYLLDPAEVAIDLVDLSAAIAPVTSGASGRDRIDAMREALTSVDGELLEDQPAALWVEHARERFRADVEQAWMHIARRAAVTGDGATAMVAAGRVRRLSPVAHDEAYDIEARACAIAGDHHRAVALVDELEQRIALDGRRPRIDLDALRAACRDPAHGATPIRTVLAPVEPLAFVGREPELAELRSHCAEDRGARCSVALIDAPAGYGRTHLLATLTEGTPGAIVVTCHPGDRGRPLLVAARVLRAVSASTGRTRSARPADSATVLFQRLVAVVERAGSVVIGIDDAHRADDASIAVLAALAEPGTALGVHLVLTARSAFADELAQRVGGAGPRIRLGPIGEASVAVPAGAWDEAGGHPATLAACLAAARRDGVLHRGEVDAVTARVDELPAAYRAVVVASAAAGDGGATLRVLATRTGMTAADVDRAVAAALDVGVLSREGRVVRVIPDILRRALAGRING